MTFEDKKEAATAAVKAVFADTTAMPRATREFLSDLVDDIESTLDSLSDLI